MSTLNFTVTATVEEFSDFADRLGYMSVVTTGLDTAGQPFTEPNPEGKDAFLLRIMKEQIATTFYQPFVRDIETQVRDTREAEKEAMREIVRSRVGVTFTA
jgi:hypothetical protein